MPAPRVSVLVAVYNGEDDIEACLDSLEGQTFGEWEAVVVDDASTDGTAAILDRRASPRIRIIHLERNVGVSAARNIAAAAAKGEYLAVLDADDLSLPERLERQIAFLDGAADYAALSCFFRLESELGSTKIAKRPVGDRNIRNGIVWSCPIVHSGLTMRAAAFHEAGGYSEEHLHGEDYRLIACIAARHKVDNLPEVLVVKRESRTGLTFRLSPWRHFLTGWATRMAVARTLRVPPHHYLIAAAAACAILLVRIFNINRETAKRAVAGGS